MTELAIPDTTSAARYDDESLQGIKTYQDAFGLLGKEFIAEDYAEAYGTGFIVLNDKAQLVGKNFLILEWRFTKSDKFGDDNSFVSCEIITEANEKFIVNDGSVGMRAQLARVTTSRLERDASMEQATRGLMVRGGLSQSDYKVEDAKGKMINATTFYLAG